MKDIVYIDCFSGISGDMMVGALLDMGLDFSFLKNELKKMDISSYSIDCREVKRGSIKAKKFDVKIAGPQPDRDYRDIKRIIGSSKLDAEVKKISLDIFKLIAEAEAKVHGHDVERIHFHEIGALDSIIDIVSAAIGIKSLNTGLFYSRRIPLGSGFVNGTHGKLPVPAPATIEILRGLPVFGGKFNFEATTPTGAAIIKSIAIGYDGVPPLIIEKVGYGAGSREDKGIINVLRILSGAAKDGHGARAENLIMLSTNIDDSNPEIISYLQQRLFKNKALDVWTEPIYMKKSRPAFKLCVLCDRQSESSMVDTVLMESTTLGIRRQEVIRYSAGREIKTVGLPYGEVRVKIGIHAGKEVTVSPEFESCQKLAEKTGMPLKKIYQDAVLFFSKR